MILDQITSLYKKYEIYISLVTFSSGLVLTFFTLSQVDNWAENLWIVLNLLIVISAIFVSTWYENSLQKKQIAKKDKNNFFFFLTLFIQFAFGGLFATYFVFYIRSASVFDSWFFLLVLVTFLVGNEIWKRHYEKLAFQISVLFVALYLFLIFLIPVLFHRLGWDLFLASGIISLFLIFVFTYALKIFAKEKFQASHHTLRKAILAIFLLMNMMYFTNIIPPIPLSLKTVGVYHSVVKNANSSYTAKAEIKKWTNYFTRYPVFHKQAGEAVYIFSSIFSPIKFEEEIVHEWQYYNKKEKKWQHSSRIVIPILGGREEGFRNYSFKNNTTAGLWRVKVLTTSGQVLGKINFEIKNAIYTPEFVNKSL